MPFTTSFSRPIVWPSSTVTTPSLPTSSITSEISFPTSGSSEEIVATWAISSLERTGFANLFNSSTTNFTAFSMPLRIAIGSLPATIFFIPSSVMLWAKTVAVVVPSPATSLVFWATSLSNEAPTFSNLSSNSISLATVTPSLVITGEPYPLSKITDRPFGPMVTLTASASLSMPFLMLARAWSVKSNSLDIVSRFN